MSQALELNNYLDDDQIQEAVNMAQKSIDDENLTNAVEAIEYLIACVMYRGKKPDLFKQELEDLKKAGTKPVITRADYMEGRATHRQYYGQFVNDEVKHSVMYKFGLERLLASTDEHLNDLPLREWDALGGFIFRYGEIVSRPATFYPIDGKLLKEAGEGYSPAVAVCVFKEAARQIIEEHKSK